MGVRLKNIITEYTSEEDEMFLNEFASSFQFVQVKQFDSQFKGIIGQIDETKVENESYDDDGFLKKHNCVDLDDAFEIISEFEDKVQDFSKRFPNKPFAFVDVDCFGGNCQYNGFIVKNGEIKYRQDNTHDGHITLLGKLNSNFKNWDFEPFTRDFFTKKGVIKGVINNFSIAGLWLALKNDYPDTKKYYLDGGSNELILRRHNNYYYYFKSSNNNIEISGVLYNDNDDMVNEITNIPDNSFLGMEYELEIQLLEKNNLIIKTSDNANNSTAITTEKSNDKSDFWSILKNFWS